jgi:hypothetical protein
MIRTKALLSDIKDVPRTWIFEHYLNLEEKLSGQDVKIKSVFNARDKNPSMYIYFNQSKDQYKYKDFSTDCQGDSIDLVLRLFNLSSRGESAYKIITDYNEYILTNGEVVIKEFKQHSKYKVSNFKTRTWTTIDQRYWSKYHIGSSLLEKYNVYPLESYVLSKEEDNETKELLISGNNIYGYFRKDGVLYKVYQPKIKDTKFIKVKDYIQGMDQLTMEVPYLVICSSLKDLMTFVRLGIKNAEAIAPDSENTLIPEHIIHAFKNKYKGICTLFDNDEAGIRAMQKYKDKYNLPYVILDMEKDLSDSIEKYGVANIRDMLMPLLSNKLKPKENESK